MNSQKSRGFLSVFQEISFIEPDLHCIATACMCFLTESEDKIGQGKAIDLQFNQCRYTQWKHTPMPSLQKLSDLESRVQNILVMDQLKSNTPATQTIHPSIPSRPVLLNLGHLKMYWTSSPSILQPAGC